MVQSLGFGYDVVAQASRLGAYQVLQFASRLGVELFVFFGLWKHVARELTDGNNEVFKQFIFVMCRKKRRATYKLIEYAAQAPHVHRVVIV